MPIVDVYGDISPQSELILDITSEKFAPLVMDLLPHGHAWDREDPILQELVRAESIELSRVDVRARALERELIPAQTFELLTDWETSYGLPDCAQPDTLEGRRAALAAKLLAQAGHDQSFGWWDNLISGLGYDLHFVELGPGWMTCIDECVDVLTDEAFAWAVAVDHGANDALLECIVSNNALLISFPSVHYLWTHVGTGTSSWRGICGNSKGFSVVVGVGGAVKYSDVDLDTWTIAAGVPAQDIRAVCAVDDVFVAVGAPALDAIYSLDGGKNWIASAPFAGNLLQGISRGPGVDQVAVAVGVGGQIWRTTNAGQTFTSVASPTAFSLYCVCACEGAMLAGGPGLLIRSTSNGAAPWSFVGVPGFSETIFGIAGRGQICVFVTSAGQIWRSTDAGQTWAQMLSPVTSNLLAVTASSSGRWTACGAGGVILQSLDDGMTWDLQASPTTQDLYGADYQFQSGQAFLAGNNGRLILE